MTSLTRSAALAALAACLGASPALATTITFPNFSNTAGLQLNGSAATTVTGDGSVLRLTSNGFFLGGSAFSTTQATLGAGNTFSTFFQFRLTGAVGIDPADGFAFVIQTAANNVGGLGGGLGYLGIPGNSLAVEFDTYNNGEAGGSNHVGIDQNGVLANNGVSPGGISNCTFPGNGYLSQNCMSNGHLWSAWIDYDGTNIKVAVADNSTTRPADIISMAVNLPALLGQNTAFVGFTAATGSGAENHDIVNWQFVDSFAPIPGPTSDPTVPEPASMLLIGSGLVAAVRRRRASKR